MPDDQVNMQEMAENRQRREAGAPATEHGVDVTSEQNSMTIDADAETLRKPWGARLWAILGAWGVCTHVRHPRPQ